MKAQDKPGEQPLRISLCAPGMSDIHRAGLGGLASTLRAMERAYGLGRIAKSQLPGDGITWRVLPKAIELDIQTPAGAREYLKRLFQFAFRIRDKLIELPGAVAVPVPRAVRAEHQRGLTLTFLQYGKHRDLGEDTFSAVDPDGSGLDLVTFEFRPCESFEHQTGWKLLTDSRGRLKPGLIATPSCFNPGAIVRHSGHKAATEIKEPVGHVLAACFAIVGCLSIPVNRGVGVLLVPPVTDLQTFARIRTRMTPTSLRDCWVAGPADAALQTAVRLLAAGALRDLGEEQIRVMQLRPTQWNKKQKTRTGVVTIRSADESLARRFDDAMRNLPRRHTLNLRTSEHEVTRDGKHIKVKNEEQIWIDNVVRPLIATNLAFRRHWCHEFWRLCAGRQSWVALQYEKKGLQAMAKELTVADKEQIEHERAFIGAMHRAIYIARGKIYGDGMGVDAVKQRRPASPSVKSRWKNLAVEIRTRLLQAKTRSLIQTAISKLLARTGVIKELKDRDACDFVHQFVFHANPDTARNLALFALASYQKPDDKPELPGESTIDDPTEADTEQETNA